MFWSRTTLCQSVPPSLVTYTKLLRWALIALPAVMHNDSLAQVTAFRELPRLSNCCRCQLLAPSVETATAGCTVRPAVPTTRHVVRLGHETAPALIRVVAAARQPRCQVTRPSRDTTYPARSTTIQNCSVAHVSASICPSCPADSTCHCPDSLAVFGEVVGVEAGPGWSPQAETVKASTIIDVQTIGPRLISSPQRNQLVPGVIPFTHGG